MTTPNLPIRWEIENTGAGTVDSMEIICCSVKTFGPNSKTGMVKSVSTDGTPIAANANNTVYALVGIRLKSTHLDNIVTIEGVEAITSTANDIFQWELRLNPTVAGTFNYSGLTNSAVEVARGAVANTVTGGTVLATGFATQTTGAQAIIENLRYLGSTIAGVSDKIVLTARTLSGAANIHGAITFRELA